jgi:hypothetical protein
VVDSSPVKVVWHSKINQVSWIILSLLWGPFFRSIGSRPLVYPLGFWRADLNFFCLCIGCTIIKIVTGLSSGQICVLYSPTSSLNGAKLPLSKGPPRKVTIEDMSDALAQPAIITPHALPMFREGEIARGTGKRKRERERLDPRKSRRPELPVTGPGKGGRVGASATQHVVQNLVKDTTREEDVRGCFFYSLLSERSADYRLPPALLVHAMAPSIRSHCLILAVVPLLSWLLSPLFVFHGSHERHCYDTQKVQRRTPYGQQVSGLRGPRWLLFVIVCLAVAMLTRSSVPPSFGCRPSLFPPHCSVRPGICSLDEEPTEAGVCRRRAGRGGGGKVKRGMEMFGHRRLVGCGRRFPGSVSACVYKGFGQNFPPFQSSLEIPWSPSLPPRHRHTLSVTPDPSLPVSLSSVCACILLYPAK